MCIKRFFALFCKKAKQQEPKQAKSRVREIGKYEPLSDNVRLDNVAGAAGVPTKIVRAVADEMGMVMLKVPGKKGTFVTANGAKILHRKIRETAGQ